MLLGDRRSTTYLSCEREDNPRYFRPGERDAIIFLASCGTIGHSGRAVQNIAKMDARTLENAQANKPVHYKMSSIANVHYIKVITQYH